METHDAERVGLYIKPKTRNRLNLFKSQLTIETGQVQSQDDAINYLLDLVRDDVPAHPQITEPA